jgi:heat shock protein HslJ
LRDDGHVSGHTGCRRFSGEWKEDGNTIFFTRLEMYGDSLVGACAPKLAEQDNHIGGVLELGFTAEIEGNRLLIRHDQGDQGLVYRYPR